MMKKLFMTLISAVFAIVAMAAGAKLWVHSHSGNHISIDIADLDSIGFTYDGSGIFDIEDICGNTYKCITIGNQEWMAENMRCNKYDTRSELAGTTIPYYSSKSVYEPYWGNGYNNGYYNWAAAVGIDGKAAEEKTGSFNGNRQGICPNGWHVPTFKDWRTLENYIGSNDGRKLKSISGWYSGGNGTDTYYFAAHPDGCLYRGYSDSFPSYKDRGEFAYFWLADPASSGYAYYSYLSYSDVMEVSTWDRRIAVSVRCVRNKNEPNYVLSINLSDTVYSFTAAGQTVQLAATMSPSNATYQTVTWESSNTAVATVSNVGRITSIANGRAIITATADGRSATCEVSVDDGGRVVDICGNRYRYVNIGNQVWMAENLRCNKYDTESECPGVTLSTYNGIDGFDPYYSDASTVVASCKDGLTSDQRCKLGYLYNWAAAVGLSSAYAAQNQSSNFNGNRQGICPNGWHMPTVAEWFTLINYVGSNLKYKLTAKYGWGAYNGDGDPFSFEVLPTGEGAGNNVMDACSEASFWTAIRNTNDNDFACYCSLYTKSSYAQSCVMSYARSVRCVKDVSVQSVSLSKTSLNFQTIGSSEQLTATVLPSDASHPNVTWKSSDTSVATVSDVGFVTCTGFGKTTIIATADGKSATCAVKVAIPVQSITLSKTSCSFMIIGETFQLTASVSPYNATFPSVTWISSNTSVATVNENGLVTCKGFGNAIITAIADGKSARCSVYADDKNVTDVCGNKYQCVTIGNQIWMAENMRCNKYDTQSERAGATLYTSYELSYSPYYVNASNKSNWYSTQNSGKLSNEQISKLGYQYNWAAAVGLETAQESKGRTSSFSSLRQGICPNGWHVPTSSEWNTLRNYIGSSGAGKKLKTTSGWYNNNCNGTDAFSFAALPAGSANGSLVDLVGEEAVFWSATPDLTYSTAGGSMLDCDNDILYNFSGCKDMAQSVRCVRN